MTGMHIIGKYFSLTSGQSDQLSQLGPSYSYWNERINVISRKDIEHLYLHHVLHSLSIAKITSFHAGTVFIDAGTGGGFPGIPLAIMFPESHFILTDSIGKKIAVVNGIIKETGLANCETRNIRLEDLKDKADFIVCRAVGTIPQLFKWVSKNIVPGGKNQLRNGLLALKGGDLTSELKELKTPVNIFNLSDYFSESYFETKKLVHLIK